MVNLDRMILIALDGAKNIELGEHFAVRAVNEGYRRVLFRHKERQQCELFMSAIKSFEV